MPGPDRLNKRDPMMEHGMILASELTERKYCQSPGLDCPRHRRSPSRPGVGDFLGLNLAVHRQAGELG